MPTPDDRAAHARREARVWLWLAHQFGWPPSELAKIPGPVVQAMHSELASLQAAAPALNPEPEQSEPGDEPGFSLPDDDTPAG